MYPRGSRVALVTGGSRGIGRAISLRLAEDGFNVIINYVANRSAADDIRKLFGERGYLDPDLVQADVSDSTDVRRLFKHIQQQHGDLSVLVNNAGVRDDQIFLVSDEKRWWAVHNTNLAGVVNCSRLALPMMLARRSGHIINVTSISGRRGTAGQTAYAASKAAIVGFSKSLAREVGPYGIVINCVAPGLIETDMTNQLKKGVVERYVSSAPLNRLGKAEEVARVIGLLASDGANFLFGQEIVVDGGATM